jgi:hypothetical protein
VKDSFKKEDVPQKEFLKDLGLMLKTICTNSICGKCLAKMFEFALMSKIKPPFQNIVFTRGIAKVSGENKSNVCSS